MSDPATSLSQAMTLATRLRSMSEKLKEGEFKRILDALLLELAEAQLKLDEFLSEHATLKGQAHAQANPQGELCPRCGALGWKVTGSRPHKTPGVVVQTHGCAKCGLKEETLVKPK
jgi:hypothetical protein